MTKRVLCICLCLIMSAQAVSAGEETPVETEVVTTIINRDDYSFQLIEKIRMQRNTIYNSLNLTPSQIKKTAEIDKHRYAELEPELRKMCLARKKVKDLTDCMTRGDNCCTKGELKAAKKEFDTASDNIKCISNKYDKEFKEKLTSDQKSKYKMIRKLKKADLKKLAKTCKNGQKPADLRPFGMPVSQAEYSEEMKKQNSFRHRSKNKK